MFPILLFIILFWYWINSHFTTIIYHFSVNYVFIFHKTEFQTVILRCLTSLNLNWCKYYDTKRKCFLVGVVTNRRWSSRLFSGGSLLKIVIWSTKSSWTLNCPTSPNQPKFEPTTGLRLFVTETIPIKVSRQAPDKEAWPSLYHYCS